MARKRRWWSTIGFRGTLFWGNVTKLGISQNHCLDPLVSNLTLFVCMCSCSSNLYPSCGGQRLLLTQMTGTHKAWRVWPMKWPFHGKNEWKWWYQEVIYIYIYIWSRVPCSHPPPMGWGGVWCPCGGVYTYIHTYIPTYLPTYLRTYIHTYHYITLPYITLPYLTLPYLTFHTYIHTYLHTYVHTYIHTITLPYLTLPYLTLHYLTLHSIHTYIHYITLHYITLHYIT